MKRTQKLIIGLLLTLGNLSAKATRAPAESASMSYQSAMSLARANDERRAKAVCNPREMHAISVASQIAYRSAGQLKMKALNASKLTSLNQTIRSRLFSAYQVLECSQNMIPRLTYTCHERMPQAYAQTFPYFGTQVWISRDFFFKLTDMQRAGTTLHESTHKCGAYNDTLINTQTVARNFKGNWTGVADFYAYWLENGFCIPGHNC